MKSRYPAVKSHPEGLEFYRSGLLRLWRWRIKASNGKIIGSSSESYWNKKECEDNCISVQKSIAASKFVQEIG